MVITPSSRRHHGLRRGLVSFWPLNEASGTRFDAHGGNDLTDNNTVGQSTGITGKPYTEAADFVRANGEHFSYTHDGTFSFVDYLTVCAWVKIDSFDSSGNWIINKRATTETAGWQLIALNSDKKVYFNGYTGSNQFAGGTTVLSTATWYFVHGQIDNLTLRVGVNGVWEGTKALGGSVAASTNNLVLGLGSWNTSATGVRHDGNMQAIGIWNRALTEAEITSLYNAGSGITYEQF